jgi:hypothetical protein
MVPVVFLLATGLLIGVPLLVGYAFGKKPAVVAAVGILLVGGSLFFMLSVDQAVKKETARELPAEAFEESPGGASHNVRVAAAEHGVERPIAPPQDPAYQVFAVLLSEHLTFSNRARPTWADENPGLKAGVYRWPVKSGLYSTQEECRQALAVAVAQAVAQYGKTLLAEPSAASALLRQPDWLVGMQQNHAHFAQAGVDGQPAGPLIRDDGQGTHFFYHESPKTSVPGSGSSASAQPAPFPQVTASGRTNLIEQPLFAESVQTSVGPMHELHALLEFGDNARAQIRQAWWRTLIPLRLRWVTCGFGAVLAIIGVLLAALRFDLASGGKHRGRLRWATALTILLVVGSAWGLCLL